MSYDALFRLQICFSNQIFNTDCAFFTSDQIGVSRHHQPIFMGCCGNDQGVSNYARWQHDFPTWKLVKWRSNDRAAEGCCSLCCPPYSSASASVVCSAALMHLLHSGFDVIVASDAKDTSKSDLTDLS